MKVLVIGTKIGSSTVTSYSWDDVPEGLNVADFDKVVLSLVAESGEGVKSLAVSYAPNLDQVRRLIFSQNSSLVVIGHPHVVLRPGQGGSVRVTSLLPAFPKIHTDAGEEIISMDEQFAFHFKHVKRYTWFADLQYMEDQVGNQAQYMQAVYAKAHGLKAASKSLADTRFHRAIGFTLTYTPLVKVGSDIKTKPASMVTWLPPSELSATEATAAVLNNVFGVELRASAPPWTDNLILPSGVSISKEIAELNRSIAAAEEQRKAKTNDLNREMQWIRLLYERDTALEPLVRDALALLGADAAAPSRPGREDGRITLADGRRGILEVKGKGGSISLRDVRQLDQWVKDAFADDGYDGKGILVANTFADELPDNRLESFPDNCIKFAERFGLALLTTRQIVKAIVQSQKGSYVETEFWDAVFGANGVADLPEVTTGDMNGGRAF